MKKKYFDAVGWTHTAVGCMVELGAGWALAGRTGLAAGASVGRRGRRRACMAREAGGHAWGARAWRAGRAGSMGAGALGGTGAGARGAGARGRARSVRGRAGWAAGARPGRWARGLGAWAGLGQCTRCTLPIFYPF